MSIALALPADGRAMFSSFSVPVLKVRNFPGPLWDLCDEFGFYSLIVKEWIVAPKLFRTDGCSVPALALSFVGYVADEPGYIHDLLYTTQKYPRATADAILREMLITLGYGSVKAQAFYLAVRAGGGSHWTLPNVPQPAHVVSQLVAAGHPIPS